jgi:hypothetical protein
MSAAEIKPIPVNSNLPSASGEAAPPEAAVGLPAHPIYEIEPEALELLREFFLLLDQWDRQQEK